jgi:hypothetical protein
MTRRAAKTRSCDPTEADKRLRQAQKFADHAELEPDSEDGVARSAAVSNAVLAGIAAVDALCCKRLGRRSNSNDHTDALVLVRQVAELGAKAERLLQALLAVKNKAQYESADPNPTETKKALRAMRQLIELARTA